jgi:hypothetical protein
MSTGSIKISLLTLMFVIVKDYDDILRREGDNLVMIICHPKESVPVKVWHMAGER